MRIVVHFVEFIFLCPYIEPDLWAQYKNTVTAQTLLFGFL
jgi:hypothetical protein